MEKEKKDTRVNVYHQTRGCEMIRKAKGEGNAQSLLTFFSFFYTRPAQTSVQV